jgi:outer membrane protein assembly factor BamB
VNASLDAHPRARETAAPLNGPVPVSRHAVAHFHAFRAESLARPGQDGRLNGHRSAPVREQVLSSEGPTMRRASARTIACTVASTAVLSAICVASPSHADWSNLGGNAGRNGLTTAIGPETPSLRWSGAPESLISWTPIVEGNRVFAIRQTVAENPVVGPGDSVLHAMNLTNGEALWSYDFPWEPGDWTTVLYGAKNGRVYAGRADDGSVYTSAIHCIDAATGKLLWISSCSDCAPGLYDGAVFAADGDLIVAAGQWVKRIDSETGELLWSAARLCSVTNSCGPTLVGNAIYIDEAFQGAQRITRIDATTGARLHSSPSVPAFITQTKPFAGSNGIVFYPVYTGAGPTQDRLYAFRDTGTAFQLLWSQPCTTFQGEHAITNDGGVILMNPEGRLEIRDQVTSALRFVSAEVVAAAPIALTMPHIAVDGQGKIFYGNGGFPGKIFSFNPDLTLRWSIDVPNLNQGGPVLAANGTLLVAGVGNDFRAYYAPPCVAADLNCDGSVNAQDLAALLGAWGGTGTGDLNGDGSVGAQDLAILLSAWS